MVGKSVLALTALAGASTALAQLSLFGLTLSQGCETALLGAFTSSNISQCLPVSTLIPAFTSSAPLIPALDSFMSDVCYTTPCSNATLQAATATIAAGCSSSLSNVTGSSSTNNSDSLVMDVLQVYPVIREVLCLKTSNPYGTNNTADFLGPAPIPITSYNSTNGTFCVTSVLTQLSAYFGTNLTLPFIESISTHMNTTASGLYSGISSTFLCNDCIFAGVDVVERAYPSVGMTPVQEVAGVFNMSSSSTMTLNGLLNSTCAYENLATTTNGTLPANITVSIINSTFPYNLTTARTSTNSSMAKRIFGL